MNFAICVTFFLISSGKEFLRTSRYFSFLYFTCIACFIESGCVILFYDFTCYVKIMLFKHSIYLLKLTKLV